MCDWFLNPSKLHRSPEGGKYTNKHQIPLRNDHNDDTQDTNDDGNDGGCGSDDDDGDDDYEVDYDDDDKQNHLLHYHPRQH